jgi:hypothetical protein
MNPPPIPQPSGFTIEPLPHKPTPASVIEALLKRPGRIVHELRDNRSRTTAALLLVLALSGMALYGVVVATLSGGAQLWIAPLKMVLGTLLAMLICLPSLYIFSCLDGVDARIGTIAGLMVSAVCLAALLLIGFAPVGWIFSQSTDSVALMGALHLLFWMIAIGFGLRLLGTATAFLGRGKRTHLRVWNLIFILVCLQMTTALRPIIGKSDRFLSDEKKFFIAHWLDTISRGH